jgi:hypothetical protein
VRGPPVRDADWAAARTEFLQSSKQKQDAGTGCAGGVRVSLLFMPASHERVIRPPANRHQHRRQYDLADSEFAENELSTSLASVEGLLTNTWGSFLDRTAILRRYLGERNMDLLWLTVSAALAV